MSAGTTEIRTGTNWAICWNGSVSAGTTEIRTGTNWAICWNGSVSAGTTEIRTGTNWAICWNGSVSAGTTEIGREAQTERDTGIVPCLLGQISREAPNKAPG